jgi:hypothetical protein
MRGADALKDDTMRGWRTQEASGAHDSRLSELHCVTTNELCSQQARAAGRLDLLFSLLAEELGLDRDGLLGELALAQHLKETELCHVEKGDSAVSLLRVFLALLKANHAPQLIDVDRRFVVGVLLVVEVPHTDLSEITRMVLIESNPVHMLATSVTTTALVLAMLADTTITAMNATAFFPVFLESGRLSTETVDQIQITVRFMTMYSTSTS